MVAEPCGRPDTVESPTLALKDLLAKAVAIAGSVGEVIVSTIGLDRGEVRRQSRYGR